MEIKTSADFNSLARVESKRDLSLEKEQTVKKPEKERVVIIENLNAGSSPTPEE